MPAGLGSLISDALRTTGGPQGTSVSGPATPVGGNWGVNSSYNPLAAAIRRLQDGAGVNGYPLLPQGAGTGGLQYGQDDVQQIIDTNVPNTFPVGGTPILGGGTDNTGVGGLLNSGMSLEQVAEMIRNQDPALTDIGGQMNGWDIINGNASGAAAPDPFAFTELQNTIQNGQTPIPTSQSELATALGGMTLEQLGGGPQSVSPTPPELSLEAQAQLATNFGNGQWSTGIGAGMPGMPNYDFGMTNIDLTALQNELAGLMASTTAPVAPAPVAPPKDGPGTTPPIIANPGTMPSPPAPVPQPPAPIITVPPPKPGTGDTPPTINPGTMPTERRRRLALSSALRR